MRILIGLLSFVVCIACYSVAEKEKANIAPIYSQLEWTPSAVECKIKQAEIEVESLEADLKEASEVYARLYKLGKCGTTPEANVHKQYYEKNRIALKLKGAKVKVEELRAILEAGRIQVRSNK